MHHHSIIHAMPHSYVPWLIHIVQPHDPSLAARNWRAYAHPTLTNNPVTPHIPTRHIVHTITERRTHDWVMAHRHKSWQHAATASTRGTHMVLQILSLPQRHLHCTGVCRLSKRLLHSLKHGRLGIFWHPTHLHNTDVTTIHSWRLFCSVSQSLMNSTVWQHMYILTSYTHPWRRLCRNPFTTIFFSNSSCYAYVIRNLTSAWEACNSTEVWKLEEIDPYLSFVNTPSLEPFVTVTPSSKFVWHSGDARLRYPSCFNMRYAKVQHVFQYARFSLWHLEYAGCVCAAGI